MNNELGIIRHDRLLQPYADTINRRHANILKREMELTQGQLSLGEFANGHMYFGLNRTSDGWVFREWAPAASRIYLIGDFSGWQEQETFRLYPLENGVWELWLEPSQLQHGQHYKLSIHSSSGKFERIPAWATRVVQNDSTKIFSAQVWDPQYEYEFRVKHFKPHTSPLLIYECHIGMATEQERVGIFNEFRENVLPRIAALGYNAIQLMAIQEHPYYGSFGYHVSSFFAPSSRFGTPEELKQLVDAAHELGIAVIMDLVHSHAVKNEVEGLGSFDGTPFQYFHEGSRREHPAWDSLCFDYAKPQVQHYLLSNCKYWLQEFKFDGFRFDGVTSMIYLTHGLNQAFTSYNDYYNGNQDEDAIAYLALANKLVHQFNPNAITIAEEMSGMPGVATKQEDGGLGFDYRMAMGIPDYWIKLTKDHTDEEWRPSDIYGQLTNRRKEEKTISYAESHDQALVGDKTIIFRLTDAKMYWHMRIEDADLTVNRGIALHKMIRLITAATINGGYLNFMGNEFGHPEWIDFPREGNGWSYKYARRQWSLATDPSLKYQYLAKFDRAMVSLLKGMKDFHRTALAKLWDKDDDQVLAFGRNDLVFVFNFNPNQSFTDYGILAPTGKYTVILNTDAKEFGGFGSNDDSIEHLTQPPPLHRSNSKEWLKLYLPSRTALVLRKVRDRAILKPSFWPLNNG
ncbi:alpha amylase C-terminal domain-containing protein [uncultured Acetobacteroides sp.]|uniref:alpha amylase C-terminal domain-containing protein n=1 Tax=uncultured Acetobacteroides sp. TaxID=1760811 RepID=UPI0029F4A452|nr:alpha amylase C-terminal domain-containing protein [uncultured Acetobacteroides sp.]